MSDANKALIRPLYEEAFSKGNVDVVDKILAPNFVTRTLRPRNLPSDRNSFKTLVKILREVMPDLQFTIEDMIAEGDKVVARWSARGTHLGGQMGKAPTGKQITFTGIDILHIAEGMAVDRWGEDDLDGLMRQISDGPLNQQ